MEIEDRLMPTNLKSYFFSAVFGWPLAVSWRNWPHEETGFFVVNNEKYQLCLTRIDVDDLVALTFYLGHLQFSPKRGNEKFSLSFEETTKNKGLIFSTIAHALKEKDREKHSNILTLMIGNEEDINYLSLTIQEICNKMITEFNDRSNIFPVIDEFGNLGMSIIDPNIPDKKIDDLLFALRLTRK